MTAELLREAAALMRRRAEAATPGPWESSVWDSGLSYRALNASVITSLMGDSVANADYDGYAEGPHGAEGADAAHIASWHPLVALAVADWLDSAAREHDEAECFAFEPPNGCHEAHRALAVARAYLGRDA